MTRLLRTCGEGRQRFQYPRWCARDLVFTLWCAGDDRCCSTIWESTVTESLWSASNFSNIRGFMKSVKITLAIILFYSLSAWATPLGSSARTVIPSDIQQIISVDYRALKNSDTAMALKAQVLPPALKEF